MTQQGINQTQIARRPRCAVQRLPDHHRGNGDVSYLPSALVGPGVPQLPVDMFGNLYATASGTGPGLAVVDLDTNVRDRLTIAGLHGRVARMKRC